MRSRRGRCEHVYGDGEDVCGKEVGAHLLLHRHLILRKSGSLVGKRKSALISDSVERGRMGASDLTLGMGKGGEYQCVRVGVGSRWMSR